MKYRDLVESYFKGLKASQSQVRRDSALALGTAKSDVIPRLVESLGGTPSYLIEGDARSNSAAGTALVKHDPAIVVPRLLELIQTGKPTARREAVATIREFGHAAKAASHVLLELLHDSSPAVRREAAVALGCVGANSIDEQHSQVHELCRVLRSTDESDVRIEAAWAIGQLDQSKWSEDVLSSHASDPDPCVRLHVAAASGLVNGDARPALELLGQALLGRATREQYEAAVALGGMGHRLSEGSDIIAWPLNVALFDDNSKVKRYAANALGYWRWGATGNVPRLQLLMADGDGAVRWSACSAFCRIFEYPEWMTHPDLEHVWWNTLNELANAADRTYGYLVRALYDPEAAVRSNAAFILSRICEFRKHLAIPTMDLLRGALIRETHPNVCLFLLFSIRDILEGTRENHDGLQQQIIAIVRESFDSTRIRKQALSVLAALGPGDVGHIPLVLETFLDSDAESRQDLAEFLHKAGPDAANIVLNELWNREKELQRIQASAAESVGQPSESRGLERMGSEVVELVKELRLFWRLGHIFRTRNLNQMTYGKIEEALWEDFQEQVGSKTIKKRLSRLNEFLEDYYTRHHRYTRSTLAFFDFVQGRPLEIRETGWSAWEEVNVYFQRLGESTI